MSEFFVSCPLNFENTLAEEMESFWFKMIDLDGHPTREPFPEIKIEQGGIEFECPIHLGYQVNFFTKIGFRVLYRVEHFKARYFDQFEKGFQAIKFESIFDFSQNKKLILKIESSKSRLFHEKNLLSSATQVLAKKNITVVLEDLSGSTPTVFIRIFNDQVTVSADTSGEHLHFRGYRKQQGEAPLRENLAALVLRKAKLLNSYHCTIIDPFCGSGTVLFEAALAYFPVFKDFSFLKFKNCPAIFKSESFVKNFRWINPSTEFQLVGIEKNTETYQKSIANLQTFTKNFFDPKIKFINEDNVKTDLEQFSELKNVWIVTNPPYGERMAQENAIQQLQRYESIKLIQGLVVIHPMDWNFKFKNLQLKEKVPFTNQGLKLFLSVFQNHLLSK